MKKGVLFTSHNNIQFIYNYFSMPKYSMVKYFLFRNNFSYKLFKIILIDV